MVPKQNSRENPTIRFYKVLQLSVPSAPPHISGKGPFSRRPIRILSCKSDFEFGDNQTTSVVYKKRQLEQELTHIIAQHPNGIDTRMLIGMVQNRHRVPHDKPAPYCGNDRLGTAHDSIQTPCPYSGRTIQYRIMLQPSKEGRKL